MAQDLAKYGIVPKKTNKTYLPILDDTVMPHLIRGILDGDGSIRAIQTDKNNRFAHNISFCGTHQLMEDISNYCKKLDLTIIPKVYDYADKQLSEIKIQNVQDIYTFGEWIYKDATIYLKRKKEIYDCFKEHYNLK